MAATKAHFGDHILQKDLNGRLEALALHVFLAKWLTCKKVR